jgi:hypothetical protein
VNQLSTRYVSSLGIRCAFIWITAAVATFYIWDTFGPKTDPRNDLSTVRASVERIRHQIDSLNARPPLPSLSTSWKRLSLHAQFFDVVRTPVDSQNPQVKLYEGALPHWDAVLSGRVDLLTDLLRRLGAEVPFELFNYQIDGNGKMTVYISVLGTER